MSDLNQGGASPNNEPTISKNEFEKVQATNVQLARDLDTLKGQLLDTEYLSYLEAKKVNKTVGNTAVAPNGNTSINGLTLAQLQQVIAQQVGQTLQDVMKPVYGKINEIQAKQEVEDVRLRYADFDEFKDKVVSILESAPNTELSIEQAYLQAKGLKANEVIEPVKEETAPVSNEKPGGTVPLTGESAQRHKDPQAAGVAAWNEVRGKYGLSGDTI